MRRALLLCSLLAGCTVGPDYVKPDMPLPPSFKAPSQADAPLSMPVAESVDLSTWWKQFHDAELESLITRALAQNLDLLTAQSRVREARQQEIIAGAPGLPQVNAIGNTIQAHSGNNPLAGLGGGQSSGSSGAPARGGLNLHQYAVGFDATWEPDIFGGVRRSVEAAEAGTEAARWQMRDGEVSLTGEIAADYVQLRADQVRLQILTEQEKAQRDVLALTAAKARAGFVTELDVNQQQQLVAQTAAQRPPLVADIMVQRHAIAVLLGQAPGALDDELNTTAPLPPIPPRLPIGLPADLLRMRPDIRMAERKLAQANAQVGVSTADLYPKFNLIAAVTSASSSVGGLFNSSSISEIGLGSITWPIFHGGEIHANIHGKEEEYKQAYYAWQKAVLGGIQNSEDALVRYQTEQQRYITLEGAVKTARASTALALQQYKTGLVTYINVLQAQNTQFQAEDNLAQSRSSLSADLVAVYKALGGGWKEEPVEPATADNQIFRQ
jgi:NodT family efflux transporter outer membrane factor (OMF) lipoprotein